VREREGISMLVEKPVGVECMCMSRICVCMCVCVCECVCVQADLCVSLGTSLRVAPASQLPILTTDLGGVVVWIYYIIYMCVCVCGVYVICCCCFNGFYNYCCNYYCYYY